MAEIDEFIEALINAFDPRFGRRSKEAANLYRSMYGPALLAVARVALERAAEVADYYARNQPDCDGQTACEYVAGDIRALIQPEKEPS